jgi:hypothetical protein
MGFLHEHIDSNNHSECFWRRGDRVRLSSRQVASR